ncbi:hypothetical protein EC957_009106 [Mortierella hygrophila]|uniref:Uncharacterized protein n=1 Tax=Mortierella hygrophila TaxID=979708 RepID=A0A9P6K582_9FUNG|nr:hypothetical protein EC957_009106 [Mortierella hygrophila]
MNTQQETFEASMRAFVDQLQTRIEPVVFQMPSQVVFMRASSVSRISCRDTISGSRPEEPYLVSSSGTSFGCGSLSLSIGTDLWNHPFWSQDRPRHKQPLSHRNTTHPPLQHKTTVIQLSIGPEYPGAEPDSPTTNQPSDNNSKAKAEKDSTITKKPPVTLETGTLAANTKRSFTPSSASASSKPTTATPAPSTPVLDRPDLQRLVVQCIQEAPRPSAGVKREAQ